jgi:hypothetical protein
MIITPLRAGGLSGPEAGAEPGPEGKEGKEEILLLTSHGDRNKKPTSSIERVGFFVRTVCDSNLKAYVSAMKPLRLHSWLYRVKSGSRVRELE